MNRLSRLPGFIIAFCTLTLLLFSAGISSQAGSAPTNTEKLAAYGKVWGFLKYYHPNVATGKIDWDSVLVQGIPKVTAATSNKKFNAAILDLIKAAGPINIAINKNSKTKPKEQLQVLVNFRWFEDKNFSRRTRNELQKIKNNKLTGNNWYAQRTRKGIASFANEKPYAESLFPAEEFRLLALFRYWNIIEYFFPYKHLINTDWQKVLPEYVPQFIAVQDSMQYNWLLLKLTSEIEDGHVTTRGKFNTNGAFKYFPPVKVEFINGETVVTKLLDPGNTYPVKVGDVVLAKAGLPLTAIKDSLSEYFRASNQQATQQRIHNFLLMHNERKIPLKLKRNNSLLDVVVDGLAPGELPRIKKEPKSSFKLIDDKYAYLNLSMLDTLGFDSVYQQVYNKAAIIFDLSDYPQFGHFRRLPDYFFPDKRVVAKYRLPNFQVPGTFYDTVDVFGPSESQSYFKGKVIVLVNSNTQSLPELITMVLQAGPNTTVIGSQTAGADGDVGYVELPGSITTRFTNVGVYYPDGTQTQKTGIKVDVEVAPSVSGVITGKDEILDKAVEYLRK